MGNINLDLTARVIFERTAGIKTYTYRDIGADNFKLSDGSVVDTNTSNYDKDAIKASIKNIMSFLPGEEILDPAFGNEVYNLLYNPMSEELIESMRSSLRGLLNLYEPRIEVKQIDVVPYEDQSSYDVTITYTIPGLGNKSDSVNFHL